MLNPKLLIYWTNLCSIPDQASSSLSGMFHQRSLKLPLCSSLPSIYNGNITEESSLASTGIPVSCAVPTDSFVAC